MKGVTAINRSKVLIVTVSIGSGHTRAANAVRGALLERRLASQATVVDFLDDRDTASRVIKETYLKMIGVFPHAYEYIYRWSQESMPGYSLGNLTAYLMKNKLWRMLAEHRPDIVVFTHPFPCCAAASLRRSRKISLPMAAVLTDFAVHRLWVHQEVDLYFVASQEMKDALCALNISGERICATGIPVAAGFAGILPCCPNGKEPSILIMGGGGGLGAIEQAIARLEKIGRRLSITVVAGANETLRKRICAAAIESRHNIKALGYTDKVPELMAAADLLITKPGALTCSEALATKTPLLLYGALPGQEEENADYLVRQGVAIRVNSAEKLGHTVLQMLSRPQMLNAMQSRAAVLGCPEAAIAIAAVIGDRLLLRRVNQAG